MSATTMGWECGGQEQGCGKVTAPEWQVVHCLAWECALVPVSVEEQLGRGKCEQGKARVRVRKGRCGCIQGVTLVSPHRSHHNWCQ